MALWNDKTDPDAFPTLPSLPALSRSACLSPRGLRSFLSLSRHSADDVLRQRINSLINDKDNAGTSKATICTDFAREFLFKSWKTRLTAIEYCAEEARILKTQLERNTEPEVQRVVENSDLRIDPYAQKDIDTLKELKYRELSALENWVNNEKTIESIVQQRSEEVLRDTCDMDGWMGMFKSWSATQK